MRLTPAVTMLEKTVQALGGLADRFVFVGGSTIELLLTNPGASMPRATDDVDVIAQVTSRVAYHDLEDQLRAAGFAQHMDEPVICRWFGHGLKLDVMPDDDRILGFANQWYGSAILHAKRVKLPSGAEISLIDGPHLLATKLAAYADRGKDDPYLSHDFEDMVLLIHGRDELVTEVGACPGEAKEFIGAEFGKLLSRRDLLEAVEGALASVGDSYKQAKEVLEKMKKLATNEL